MKDPTNITSGVTKLFNTVVLETTAKCNRKCSFCPSSVSPREEHQMPMELVTKVLDELKELKFAGQLHLYMYGEPLRDPRLADIARMARERMPKVSIMINTNTDYVRTYEDLAVLIRSGINQMELNIYASGNTNADIQRAKDREAKMTAIVEELKREFPIDPTLPVYRPIKPNQVSIRVVPKYDFTTANRGSGVQFTTNRAGNIPGYLPGLNEPLANMCVRPFRHLNINFAGDAILCCNDYYGEANFGNVADSTLVEIWNSQAFHKYRLKLQNKHRDIFMCDKCDFKGGSYTFAVQPVTFGPECDAEILATDLRSRETLFERPPTMAKPQS